MRLFISVLFWGGVLLLAGMLIGPNFVDWNHYKLQGQQQVKAYTGYDIVMGGDVKVSIFPSPHLIVKNAQVKAPVKSQVGDLISIDSLEVYVALIPLLKGKIEVSAVNLIAPQIALEVAEDGTPNWLTPKVKVLQDKSSKGVQSAGSWSANAVPNISFERVRVKDARFQYYDAKKQSLQVFEDIDFDLSAESLRGPFDLDGNFTSHGQDVEFKASVKNLDMDRKTFPLKMQVNVEEDITLIFSGVLDYHDVLAVQGESQVAIKGLQALSGQKNLPNTLTLKGFVSGDAEAFSYEDLEIEFGRSLLKGPLSVKLSPFLVQADLQAESGLDLEPLGFVFNDFGVQVNVAMVEQNITFKNTQLDFDGQSLWFEGKYSPASSQERARVNLSVMAEALNLDKLLLQRPQHTSSSGDGEENMKTTDIQSVAQSFVLPIDLALKADIESLVYNGETLRGVNLHADVAGDRLLIGNLSVNNFMDTAISVDGGVEKLGDLSGLAANISFKSRDIKGVARYMNIDVGAFPKGLKAVTMKSFLTGDRHNFDFTSNISAMGGDVIAKGKVLNVFKNLALSDLVLQVKHPNLSQAIQNFGDENISYPALMKPLDFYVEIENEKQLYHLNNITVDLAGTPLKGDLAIDTSGKRPQISGDLKLGDFSMVSATGKVNQVQTNSQRSSVKGARGGGDRWSSDRIDTKFLHSVDMDLTFSAQSLAIDHWAVSQPSLTILLRDGILDIQDFRAALYGGTLHMAGSVKSDDEPKAPLSVSISSKLRDVDIEQLMTALTAGRPLVRGQGTVSLDSDIRTSGISQRAMIHALSGKGQVNGSDIVLKGIDLESFVRSMDVNAKAGDTVMGLWNGAKKGGSTAFETLNGVFQIDKGLVDIESMDLDGSTALISTVGNVDLPKWLIETDHSISLQSNDNVPPFEISFHGSLDDPKQTFAEGPLHTYLSKKINRKLEKLLSDRLGETLDESEVSDALGDALDGVIGDVMGENIGGALGGLLGSGR